MKNLKNWQGTAAVIGVDWGDSGKGRLIDELAASAEIVARYNGGSNTGHTVQNKFGKFALHIFPSGVFNKKTICVIGRGVALDLESLVEDEIKQLEAAGVPWKNLLIDEQATLTMPWHKLRDGLREKQRKSKIGTTGRGVGPTYADRIERVGLRAKDLIDHNFRDKIAQELNFQNKFFNLKLGLRKVLDKFAKYAKVISPLVTQTIPVVKKAINDKKNVMFEGAQGYFLDVDAGTYPYVTSSNTGILGIWRSFDIHPSQIDHVIGITKAYSTRVGAGPMPTKIDTFERDIIIKKGHEFGTTSGRIRDPGWLDLVLIKTACKDNAVNSLALTKLDILSGFKKIKVCVGYKIDGRNADYVSGDADFLEKVQPVYETLTGWEEDIAYVREFRKLPKNAQKFIARIEKVTRTPVSFIGVGPQRSQAIYV